MDDNTGSSPGTITSDNVVTDAIAKAAAGPQVPLADTADRVYEEKKDEPVQPKEEPKKEEAPKEDTTKKDASQVSTPDDTGEEVGEGYFADEGIDDEPPAPSTSQEPAKPVNLSAEEQYIANNIGSPINVRIKIGNEVRTVQAYSIDNLPDDFEYASAKDQTQAQLGFDAIIRKAEGLQKEYQTQVQQDQASNYEAQENRDIQRDIGFLQRQKQGGKDGLDRFKYAPDDPRFDNDPAVKEMQDVLDFYNKENQSRFENSKNNGTLYHRLSYRDAFRLYRLDNPKVGPEQAKEDSARKEITKGLAKAGKGQGDAPKQQRPKLPRNADVDQIARAYGL